MLMLLQEMNGRVLGMICKLKSMIYHEKACGMFLHNIYIIEKSVN